MCVGEYADMYEVVWESVWSDMRWRVGIYRAKWRNLHHEIALRKGKNKMMSFDWKKGGGASGVHRETPDMVNNAWKMLWKSWVQAGALKFDQSFDLSTQEWNLSARHLGLTGQRLSLT